MTFYDEILSSSRLSVEASRKNEDATMGTLTCFTTRKVLPSYTIDVDPHIYLARHQSANGACRSQSTASHHVLERATVL